jgi:hypothetical protein
MTDKLIYGRSKIYRYSAELYKLSLMTYLQILSGFAVEEERQYYSVTEILMLLE